MMRTPKFSKAPSSAVTLFLFTLIVYSAHGGVLHNKTHTGPDEDTTVDQPFNGQLETCKNWDHSRSEIICSIVQPAVNFSLQLETGTNQFAPNEDVQGELLCIIANSCIHDLTDKIILLN